MKGTPDDDRWALRTGALEASSFRYADPAGVVHRAVWHGAPSLFIRWESCCGMMVVEKLQEHDAGAVTCVRCLGHGA